ncbi:MAG: HAD-IIIA family hydrolase [Rhodospirillaceae bacterium]
MPDATTLQFVDDDGIWAQIVNRAPGPVRRPALFIDRDGVVVEEVPYLHDVQKARIVPGALNAIRAANRRAIPVIMVTNQGGIGIGYYGWEDFRILQDWIWNQLANADAFVNGLFACPFHPDGKGLFRKADHPDRKPNPGMILRAAEMFPVDLGRSWMVGDRDVDMRAARAAGLQGGVLVGSEHNTSAATRKDAATLSKGGFQVVVCDDRYHMSGALSPLWSAG